MLNFPEELSLAFETLCTNTIVQWKTDSVLGDNEKDTIVKKKNRRKKNRAKKKAKADWQKNEPGCNENDCAQDDACQKKVDDLIDDEFEQQIIDFELRLLKQACSS